MKKFLPDLIAILAFIILSFAYFFPADIEGRILFQHDTAAGVGAGQESKEYLERTGERTRWTNSIFGGMPTYQMSPSYDSTTSLKGVEKVYRLFLPDYVVLTFIMMLGFYILLRAFGISAWLAGLGGVIWAFSSYFFILIPAGHIWKFVTLAYIPPTIAGVVLAYRKKYLLGGIVTALFIALQIQSNHIQMSYYFMFVILFFVGAYFEDAFVITELPYNHLQYKQTALHLIDQLYGVVGGIRMNGSAAAAICYVAIGRFDAWMEAFLGKWDYSAAALIVQEAGGKVTNFYGEDHFIEGHHILATNGNLHPFFQKLLAEVPPLNM